MDAQSAAEVAAWQQDVLHPTLALADAEVEAVVATAYEGLCDPTTCDCIFVDGKQCARCWPEADLADRYADRGRQQWVYGEVTKCCALLRLLLATRAPARDDGAIDEAFEGALEPDKVFLDLGSGTGRIVLCAAAMGMWARGLPVHMAPESVVAMYRGLP